MIKRSYEWYNLRAKQGVLPIITADRILPGNAPFLGVGTCVRYTTEVIEPK